MAVTLVAAMGFAQMGEPIPTDELKKVQFLVGDYSGKEKVTMMSPTPVDSTSKSHGEMKLGGRYLQTHVEYNITGAPTMTGMHMLTYNAAKKMYEAWWFDSEVTGAMHMTGNFEGDKLVLTSDPTPMPGMGDAIMRVSWWKNGEKGVRFNLDMKQGDKFVTVMDGDYQKA